ncbi:MAG: DUF58 domain-containing protein [Planctomycetia bacterium]|nr:DUF58 domain-containing protein [Planctomycetia bacterium]
MRFTKIGHYYLLVLTMIFFVGFRREVNPLLLLSGVMLGAFWINFFIPRWTMKGLTIHISLPEFFLPGEKGEYRLELSSKSRTGLVGVWLQAMPKEGKVRLERAHEYTPQRGLQRRALVYSVTFSKRGAYEFLPVCAYCDYPFGFLVAQKTFETDEIAAHKFWVFPKLTDVPPDIYDNIVGGSSMEESPSIQNSFERRSIGEFAGLRVWTTGDLWRRIHWRASARHEQLLVQNFDAFHAPSVFILADFRGAQPEQFEENVSLAASILRDVYQETVRSTARNGIIKLCILGDKRIDLDTRTTDDFYLDAMRAFALIQLPTQKENADTSDVDFEEARFLEEFQDGGVLRLDFGTEALAHKTS